MADISDEIERGVQRTNLVIEEQRRLDARQRATAMRAAVERTHATPEERVRLLQAAMEEGAEGTAGRIRESEERVASEVRARTHELIILLLERYNEITRKRA